MESIQVKRKGVSISLNKIKEILESNNLLIKCNFDEMKIDYVSYSSREIEENTLFICKGSAFKKSYLEDAIENGSVAYISEVDYKIDGVSSFIVSDILKAMGLVSLEFFGRADKKLNKIGITGTKGKTTVSYFLHNIMEEFKKEKVGLLSSVENFCGEKYEKSNLTTPESLVLQKYFYEMVNNNIKDVVMEVSSQGYKRSRVEGVEFEYGMFLNIGLDHISEAEHPNFEDYFKCKMEFLKHCDNIVINIDSDKIDDVKKVVKGKNVVYYGKQNNANFYIGNIEQTHCGYIFEVINDAEQYNKKFEIKMKGEFNIINALAAITMAKVIGADDNSIQKGLLKTNVEGRMNIFENEGKTVIVDYAHNEISYKNLFESIKKDYPNSKIISVGGSVGGKAYNRREELGRVADEYSDYIILTTDDPQYEDANDICKDIAHSIKDKRKYTIIIDRKEAIKRAITKAKKNDIVVLLSKGGDKYQRIQNKEVPYESDIVLAKKFLNIVGE